MNTILKTDSKHVGSSKGKDAITLLRADHKLVSTLFTEYEKTRAISKKKSLASKICAELTIHAQVEEEIFYPAVKKALKDKELVPEALVEHATLKDLISQIEDAEPDGEMFDAKMKVLSEYVKHHVKEEQNEIFPQAKLSKLDLDELADKITARKEELKMNEINKEEPIDQSNDPSSNEFKERDIEKATQGSKRAKKNNLSSRNHQTQDEIQSFEESDDRQDSNIESINNGPAPLDRY